MRIARHWSTRPRLPLAGTILLLGFAGCAAEPAGHRATRPAAPRAHAASAPAVCADFSDQAAAQRAANTADPDHDGVFCESLPCPCAGPSPHTRRRVPAPAARPRVGRSLLLGPVTRRRGCRVRRGLPDPGCTPGARLARATRRQVCRVGYSAAVRDVPESRKRAVYRAYGRRRAYDGVNGEVDHLVSLELGGSNVRANLFPQAARPVPGAHEKDRLENALHAEVCARSLSLRRAQRLIATDWVAAYRARYG